MKSNQIRNRLHFERYNMQGWDLFVLLISKAADQVPNIPEKEKDESASVWRKQRLLADL